MMPASFFEIDDVPDHAVCPGCDTETAKSWDTSRSAIDCHAYEKAVKSLKPGITQIPMQEVVDLEQEQGIQYQDVKYKGEKAHVVKIDPFVSKILLVKATGLERPSVLAQKHKAVIAINAGFFKQTALLLER